MTTFCELSSQYFQLDFVRIRNIQLRKAFCNRSDSLFGAFRFQQFACNLFKYLFHVDGSLPYLDAIKSD
ncbi:Uncharacterised protein [Mycobacterium tuberculosis]|nr:Uncharacterised protein [Mycobacterium tuberculosis]